MVGHPLVGVYRTSECMGWSRTSLHMSVRTLYFGYIVHTADSHTDAHGLSHCHGLCRNFLQIGFNTHTIAYPSPDITYFSIAETREPL